MSARSIRNGTLCLLLLLLVPAVVLAQTGTEYDLSWWTVDGGGGSAAGGPYALDATLGQPDTYILSGGSYTLAGGFWYGGATPASGDHTLFFPFLKR